jgi:hypothetical protein
MQVRLSPTPLKILRCPPFLLGPSPAPQSLVQSLPLGQVLTGAAAFPKHPCHSLGRTFTPWSPSPPPSQAPSEGSLSSQSQWNLSSPGTRADCASVCGVAGLHVRAWERLGAQPETPKEGKPWAGPPLRRIAARGRSGPRYPPRGACGFWDAERRGAGRGDSWSGLPVQGRQLSQSSGLT